MTVKLDVMRSEYTGLAWAFRVNPASCGNSDHYEEYIKFIALEDYRAGMGTTHVLLEYAGENTNDPPVKMLAYITLKATSVTEVCDGVKSGKPALEITELAVSEDCALKGYGSVLVQYAIVTAKNLNQEFLGVKYVVLCADQMAVPFYEKLHFAPLRNSFDIPREGWNRDCTPMLLEIET